MARLPAAFFCGVRVIDISPRHCRTAVKHRWISQNPFGSMYFAVQAMAAELTTGALVMTEIKRSHRNISMLVGSNRSAFLKKATGKITFSCYDGELISNAIQNLNSDGIVLTLKSVGTDSSGEIVSQMEFDWKIKPKTIR